MRFGNGKVEERMVGEIRVVGHGRYELAVQDRNGTIRFGESR